MPKGARLLVIEEVVEPGKRVGNPNRVVDLDLMIHLGGRERTREDYGLLMGEAGFRIENVVHIADSFFSAIEGS